MIVTFSLRLRVHSRDMFTCKRCNRELHPFDEGMNVLRLNTSMPPTLGNLITACRVCAGKEQVLTMEQPRAVAPKRSYAAWKEDLDKMVQTVASEYGMAVAVIVGRRSTPDIVGARRLVATRAYAAGVPLTAIGVAINRDRSSVMYLLGITKKQLSTKAPPTE